VDVKSVEELGNEERKRTIINFTFSFTISRALLTIGFVVGSFLETII
jgi:hypothetical protein